VIKQETCAEIWKCYREIEAAKKLLAELKVFVEKEAEDPEAATFQNYFGEKRYLELGVPSGPDSRRLYHVPNSLGVLVIEGYIAHQQGELARLQNKAAIELAEVAA
jgi:hypothetical protein